MTTDPPSGRALSDERLAEIEALAHSPAYCDEADMIGVDELIDEMRRLTAERQEIDVRAAMGEDALLRVTAERDAAREALAASRALVEHRTATHEVKPTFCVTCRESDAALAAARPDEPTTEGGERE